MKKTIENLLTKIEENRSGTINGGFVSLKGGTSLLLANNAIVSCTNAGTCNGTNSSECSNTGHCESSSNTTTKGYGCSNTGYC